MKFFFEFFLIFQILPSKNTPCFARFFDRNQKIHGDLKVGNPFWWSFCCSIFIFKKKKCLSLILELLHLFTINAIVRHVEGLLLHTFQTWKLCLGAHTHIWTSQHRFIYMKCWRTLSSQSVFTTLEFLGALNLRPSRTASFDIVGILICFIFFWNEFVVLYV